MAADFPSTYRAMTWSQVWNFRAISKQKIPSGEIDGPLFHQQVKDWHSVALKIHASVRESLSFSQMLREIGNLQIFKRWILRWVLPSTLSTIESTIHNISLYLWRERKHQPDKQLTILKAQQYFEEHRNELLPPPNAAANAFLRLAQAAHLVQSDERTIIEQQVDNYFASKLQDIAESRDPLLPDWHHATNHVHHAVSILSSGATNVNQAPYGLGTYYSSHHEDLFGSYGVAVDHHVIERLPADYFPGLLEHSHTWLQVHTPVPINLSSLAHIVVGDANDRGALYRLLHWQASDIAIHCPIIYRKTDAIITQCFHEAKHVRILPPTPFWQPHPRSFMLQRFFQRNDIDVIEAKKLLLVS